jgi:hypothetical protein
MEYPWDCGSQGYYIAQPAVMCADAYVGVNSLAVYTGSPGQAIASSSSSHSIEGSPKTGHVIGNTRSWIHALIAIKNALFIARLWHPVPFRS